VKTVALNEAKDDLSRYLHVAEKEAVLITRHGKPAGVLIGFASEDDWLDYRLEHDPRRMGKPRLDGRRPRPGSSWPGERGEDELPGQAERLVDLENERRRAYPGGGQEAEGPQPQLLQGEPLMPRFT